ncbi:hypothetical protein Pmar_PMAR028537, partial [Perkinsus marinus ATCC 50983]
MTAAEFMAFRTRALGLLNGAITISSTFPIKGGMGLVLCDEGQGTTCVQSLNNMQGYTAKIRSGLWPRIVCFNPAVARGVTVDQLGCMVKEGNPILTKDIDGSKLVSSVFWRGQHMVLSVSPTLYHRLAAGGEGKTRL